MWTIGLPGGSLIGVKVYAESTRKRGWVSLGVIVQGVRRGRGRGGGGGCKERDMRGVNARQGSS